MGFEIVWDAAGFTVYEQPAKQTGEVKLNVGKHFTSACAGAAYLNALANDQQREGVLVGSDRRAIGLLMALCEGESHHAPVHPKPKPTPPKPAPPPTLPPAGPETSTSLGHVQPRPEALVDHQPTETQVIKERPTDAAFARQAPKPPQEVAIIVAPPAATPEQVQSISDRISRNEPEPGERHPTHSEPAPEQPTTDADPVDLFTGALLLAVVDLEVPTPFMPIRMVRRYRSGRPYFGPFGYGWDHPYNVYLRRLKDGSLAMWTGELQERTFRLAGPGWEPEPGLTARIEQVAGQVDAFRVRHPEGLIWRFERPAGWGSAERIPLASIVDRHGNGLHLTYDGQDRVAGVRDDAGRGLTFTYGQCGLLERVSDHTGTRTVQYWHHAEIEHLIRVVLPATATYPEGVTTSYEYDLDNPHPAMRHNIVRVADTQDRTYLENTFAGPEEAWAFNCVTRQLMGGFEYRFEYEQVQFVPPNTIYVDVEASRTIVRPPDGSTHCYTFNYRGDLLDHRFRLNRDGSYRVVTTRRRFDSQGNLVEEVRPDGVRTIRTFDSANPDPCARRNLLRVEIAAPVAGLIPSRTLMVTTYDPVYQLPIRTWDELGNETRVVYDFDSAVPSPTGRPVRIEMPPVTLADGSSQQSIVRLEANARGQVTAAISAEGGRCELEYVVGTLYDGFLARVTDDPGGAQLVTEYQYDAAGFPARVIRPGGRVTRTIHNALGQIEEVVRPPVPGGSGVTRQRFDDSGQCVRVERPRGAYADSVIADPSIVDTFERDVLGQVTRARLAANTVSARSWRQRTDHEGRPVSRWDETGVRTDNLYDERGLLIRQRRHVGSTGEITRFRYDVAGHVRRTEDAWGRVTEVVPDVWGRAASVTLPNGSTQSLVWGPGNRLVERRVMGRPGPGLEPRPLRQTTFEYDERGRLRRETRWSFVDNLTSGVPLTYQYQYDADDRLTLVTYPRGATTELGYDALGRPTLYRDMHGSTRVTSYDGAGDLATMVVTELDGGVAQSTTHQHVHDGRGRLVSETYLGATTEYLYDDRDVLIETREPGGRTTRFEVDPHGAPNAMVRDPSMLAQRSRWTYDPLGRVNSYVDPLGETSSWGREAGDRATSLGLPDGSVWKQVVKPAERQVEQTLPSGSRITVTYGDDLDVPVRIEAVVAPGVTAVPVHTFDYDGLGRVVRASNGVGGAIARRYDSLDRLIEETVDGRTVRIEYNDLTGAVDRVFPDGRRERIEHNVAGQPTRVILVTPGSLGGIAGQAILNIVYSGAGRPISFSYGNGVQSSLTYDVAGRLVRIEHTLGTVSLDSCRVRYDVAGHRRVVQLTGPPARTILHRFDALDRLVEARWGWPVAPLPDVQTPSQHAAAIAGVEATAGAASAGEVYVVDLADTRTSRTRLDGISTVYSLAPGHKVTSIGQTALAYHADGHRASDGRFQYDVDALGRLAAIRDVATGNTIVQLTYDALSRPASGSLGGVSFRRWFAGGTWIEEVRGPAHTRRQVSPHALWPIPLCVIDSTGAQYIQSDAGLSTLCITDASGAVRERHRYGPFGALTLYSADGASPAQAGAVDPLWRGMPELLGTGLYVTPRRLYDPDLGSFLARDPLLYVDGPSPYAFAAHNPADFADLTGLEKSPLGPDKAPPEEHSRLWQWFYARSGVWRSDPRPGDVFPEHPGVNSGSLAENLFVNFFISHTNIAARALNIRFNFEAAIGIGLGKAKTWAMSQGYSLHELNAMGNALEIISLEFGGPSSPLVGASMASSLPYLRSALPIGGLLPRIFRLLGFGRRNPQPHLGKGAEGLTQPVPPGMPWRFSNLHPEDQPTPISRFELSEAEGAWRIESERKPGAYRAPEGVYNYVVQDGKVYVRPADEVGHVDLARGGEVEYAGEVMFGRGGELEWWNNKTGHYEAWWEVAFQAPFSIELFRAEH